MQLKKDKFIFSSGQAIDISQENWDVSMALSDAQRQAREKPLEDLALQYFRETIYVGLAACSTGSVPILEEAYGMLESAPADIDRWYRVVQDINPIWFEVLDHNMDEEIEFSDGSKLTVHDANLPSCIMKLKRMELEADENPLPELNKQVFRREFYPKLACCSSGQVPDEETTRTMPSPETNKWYFAVNRVNPHLYRPFQELSKAVLAEQQKKN